jgi:hypothetical protein
LTVARLALLAALALAPAALAAELPPLPQPHVDMERVYGRWFLIATIPN